jgi:hypothetical protein
MFVTAAVLMTVVDDAEGSQDRNRSPRSPSILLEEDALLVVEVGDAD